MCCAGAQASAGLPVSLASCGGSFAKLSSVPGHAHSLKAQPSSRVQKCLFLPHVSFTPHLVSTSYVPCLLQRWGVSAMGLQKDCCWGPCVWGKGSHHDLNPSFVLVEEHRAPASPWFSLSCMSGLLGFSGLLGELGGGGSSNP